MQWFNFVGRLATVFAHVLFLGVSVLSFVFGLLVWYNAIREINKGDWRETPMTRGEVAAAVILLFGPFAASALFGWLALSFFRSVGIL